jgi:hypothetical protein
MTTRAKGSSRNQLELPFGDDNPLHTDVVFWKEKTLFKPEDPREIVSLAELAELTRFSRQKLHYWLQRRQIPGGYQLARGCTWQFERRALEAWWKQVTTDEKRK